MHQKLWSFQTMTMTSLTDTLIDTELKDNRSNKLHMFLSITNPITASYNCSADRPVYAT